MVAPGVPLVRPDWRAESASSSSPPSVVPAEHATSAAGNPKINTARRVSFTRCMMVDTIHGELPFSWIPPHAVPTQRCPNNTGKHLTSNQRRRHLLLERSCSGRLRVPLLPPLCHRWMNVRRNTSTGSETSQTQCLRRARRKCCVWMGSYRIVGAWHGRCLRPRGTVRCVCVAPC